MKVLFMVFFSCACLPATGQAIRAAINDQVWKPFIKTYNNLHTDGFLAVHSKDVVRSPRDAKMVLNWNEYYAQQKQADDQGKTSGPNDNWNFASQKELPMMLRRWKSASTR
jgi:hypothetical protein